MLKPHSVLGFALFVIIIFVALVWAGQSTSNQTRLIDKQLNDESLSTEAKLKFLIPKMGSPNQEVAKYAWDRFNEFSNDDQALVIDDLFKLTYHGNPNVKKSAIECLGNIGSNDKLVKRLEELLDDDDISVRGFTIGVIYNVDIFTDKMKDKLLSFLETKYTIRETSILLLAERADFNQSEVEYIRQFLDDNNPMVRVGAVTIFAGYNNNAAETEEILLKMVNDKNGEVRTSVYLLLFEFRADSSIVIEHCIAGFEDSNPVARRFAAMNFTHIGEKGKAAIPGLVKLLEDKDWTVRYAALSAISAMGDSRLEIIDSIYPLLDDPHSKVRDLAEQVIREVE